MEAQEVRRWAHGVCLKNRFGEHILCIVAAQSCGWATAFHSRRKTDGEWGFVCSAARVGRFSVCTTNRSRFAVRCCAFNGSMPSKSPLRCQRKPWSERDQATLRRPTAIAQWGVITQPEFAAIRRSIVLFRSIICARSVILIHARMTLPLPFRTTIKLRSHTPN